MHTQLNLECNSSSRFNLHSSCVSAPLVSSSVFDFHGYITQSLIPYDHPACI